MQKRQLNKIVIQPKALKRIKNNRCPSCGKSKKLWKRRTDWRCCSVKCTNKFNQLYITYDWREIRMKALERDNFSCVKCGDNRKDVEVNVLREKYDIEGYRKTGNWNKSYEKFIEIRTNFIGDHIKPIALGGEEFDLDNVQTLCLACNKIKTRQDAKDIAMERKRIKIKTGPLLLM